MDQTYYVHPNVCMPNIPLSVYTSVSLFRCALFFMAMISVIVSFEWNILGPLDFITDLYAKLLYRWVSRPMQYKSKKAGCYSSIPTIHHGTLHSPDGCDPVTYQKPEKSRANKYPVDIKLWHQPEVH